MNKTIGLRVKSAREAAGMNQTECAKKAGISQGYLAQIESGNRQGTAEVLRRLAAATEISVGWLLEEHGEERGGYGEDPRLKVSNDLLAAPGLRALAEDESMCHALEIVGEEWETLRSIMMRVPPDKAGYLLLLHAVRAVRQNNTRA